MSQVAIANRVQQNDQDFVRTIKAMFHTVQRFSELQRLKSNITLNDRERLLLKILWLRESRGTKGIPVTKLAAEYNITSLDRMKASESTISAMVIALEKQEYVKRDRNGKSVNVELDEKGLEFIIQENAIMEERMGIYIQICPESDREIIKQFCLRAIDEFNRRIKAWQIGF